MNLEGRKIIVNKSSQELTEMLKRPEDYKHLMPEGLKTFEATENGFNFELKGMPKIGLIIKELLPNEKVVLGSASSSLDFTLTGTLNPINDHQTETQLLFDGNFNPFIKMMVEKPLQNFINTLTDNLEKL